MTQLRRHDSSSITEEQVLAVGRLVFKRSMLSEVRAFILTAGCHPQLFWERKLMLLLIFSSVLRRQKFLHCSPLVAYLPQHLVSHCQFSQLAFLQLNGIGASCALEVCNGVAALRGKEPALDGTSVYFHLYVGEVAQLIFSLITKCSSTLRLPVIYSKQPKSQWQRKLASQTCTTSPQAQHAAADALLTAQREYQQQVADVQRCTRELHSLQAEHQKLNSLQKNAAVPGSVPFERNASCSVRCTGLEEGSAEAEEDLLARVRDSWQAFKPG